MEISATEKKLNSESQATAKHLRKNQKLMVL